MAVDMGLLSKKFWVSSFLWIGVFSWQLIVGKMRSAYERTFTIIYMYHNKGFLMSGRLVYLLKFRQMINQLSFLAYLVKANIFVVTSLL